MGRFQCNVIADTYHKVKTLDDSNEHTTIAVIQENMPNGSKYVCKQIRYRNMSKLHKKHAVQEIDLMSKLRHPNLVYLVAHINTKKVGLLSIVMDWYSGGDLFSRINDAHMNKEYIPEPWILHRTAEVLSGLAYLHDHRVVHVDIKPENICLNAHDCAKIIDYGHSDIVPKNASHITDTYNAGTPEYASPELTREKPYSFSTDIWSLGATLYLVCALRLPFGEYDGGLREDIISCTYRPINARHANCASLVNKMLQVEAEKRPTAAELLQNPVLAAYTP